ncbi:MAG: hypothetical protein BWY15_00595 [Firmicutes bacterium ADurb.Bin193]|nr:MAG: hypothetical protein BWY15_00595 [Firmicutes bacterium ADurb.Bin193]
MATKKKEEKQQLTYKGKPLLRRGNLIYYGNPEDKYIVMMTVLESTKIIDLDVSSLVSVQLQTNAAPGKEKVIKKAERDGLYSALDLGEFWLTEALSS